MLMNVTHNRHIIFMMMLIFGLVVAAFYAGLKGPLMLDDSVVIPATQLEALSYESITATIENHNSGLLGRPIPVISFILNNHFFGPDTAAYKSVNLAIHLLNTILVFLLIRKITLSTQAENDLDNLRKCTLVSLAITTLWAIHPLQASTVLYIFQRITLISSFFILCSLNAYVYGRASTHTGPKECFLLFFLFPLSIACAVLSKEIGVLVIPFVILIELTIFASAYSTRRSHFSYKIFVVVFLLIPSLIGLLYFMTHTGKYLDGYKGRDFSMADRLRTQPVVIMYYVKLILASNLTDMSLYHDSFTRYRSMSATVSLSLFVIALLSCSVAIFRKKLPIFSFGVGFFLVAHLLESTIIPLELVFEHRNYLGIFGLILPIIWYTHSAFTKLGLQRWLIALFIVSSLLLSFKTHSRSIEWSDELMMLKLAVENKPESIRARKTLIPVLENLGDHRRASELLEDTLLRHPDDFSLKFLDLAISCKRGVSIKNKINNIHDSFNTLRVDQDTAAGLQLISSLASERACAGLTDKVALKLLDAAMNSKLLTMPKQFRRNLYGELAGFYADERMYNEALKYLYIADENNPQDPWVLIAIARMHHLNNEQQLAQATLERLRQVNRKFKGTYTSATHELEIELNASSTVVSAED